MIKTSETSGFSEWLKGNIFGVVNLGLILTTFAYNYGVMSSHIGVIDAKVDANTKEVSNIEINGTAQRPAYEARLVALEKKTDDLAVLKNIVQTQNDSISKLSDLVRSDHDILLRLTMQKP